MGIACLMASRPFNFDTCQKKWQICLIENPGDRTMTCFTAEDIAKINEERIEALEESVAVYEGREYWEYCTPVYNKVREIDGMLASCYSILARAARDAESSAEVEKTWELMVGMCDMVLTTLNKLREKFPNCVRDEVFDLAFEYRKAASERLANIREEIECQSQNLIPKGLFPSLK